MLRKCFIDSIDYLRKMDFFKDYSDLASEEILEAIGGKLDYAARKYVKEGAGLDYEVAHLDAKRIFEVPRVKREKEEGISLLRGLAEISRGVFQPTDMEQDRLMWAEGKKRGELLQVRFKFKDEVHEVSFKYEEKDEGLFLVKESMEPVLLCINDLIRHSGYQYYEWANPRKEVAYIALTKEEAEKLRRERDWKLHYANPELIDKVKKRFVDSIDYLRKMDFFKDYSNLTSEEILDKILKGEMDYKYYWHELESGEPVPYGRLLKRSLYENRAYWMRASDAKIDYSIIPFDMKRTVVEDPETVVEDEIGVAILNRLARISRGVFQPTNVSSRWLTPLKWLPSGAELGKWLIREVSFDFKGRRHAIEIAIKHDWLIDIGLYELNELIKDTGYQYYQLKDEGIIVVVLREDEAEKLEKERGWSFKYIVD